MLINNIAIDYIFNALRDYPKLQQLSLISPIYSERYNSNILKIIQQLTAIKIINEQEN